MHIILLKDNVKNNIDSKKTKAHYKESVKNKITEWLDVGIVYPIYDNIRISHVQCVLQKGDMTMVFNEKNHISTRDVKG